MATIEQWQPQDWAYWPAGRETVRVLTVGNLWGYSAAEILVPSEGRAFTLPSSELRPPGSHRWVPDEVSWRAAAGQSIHLAALGKPIAWARGGLEPLPHQLAVLARALASDPVRLLLADEVGLGKTIEAGLIFAELKARGRVRRVLVVAPKGIQLQWVAEMSDRFGEEFALVGAGGVPVDVGINPWLAFDRVVCSLDSVKPVRRRQGWTLEQVDEYNERRFRAVIEAGWDLVIFDEAHHVAGSGDDVARHRLARELSAKVPHVLLLSATPHSGKTEAFARLLGLLDPTFQQGTPIAREHVARLLVRTEKRSAVDAKGAPLFRPRTTSMESIPYGERRMELALYEAVTNYVRHGYNQALAQKRPHLGFLVLLMQRLVSSSTAAILAALERRMAAIPTGCQPTLFTASEEWPDLTGEEQFEALAEAQGSVWINEQSEVASLLRLARDAASSGPDAKAAYLLNLLRRLQREEGDPSLKAVVFTEFVATQDMLLALLQSAGIPAVSINGSMGLEERRTALVEFRERAKLLVSTDAGGEGINLQFAHVVINYDLPWNPMRIEQRIGRVDRIGQIHAVRALNLVMENSVDARVLEVLEVKLWTILRELGVDKWNDVLETVSTGQGVEDLYVRAIVTPEQLEEETARLASETKNDVEAHIDLGTLVAEQSLIAGLKPGEEVAHWTRLAAEARARWLGQETADPMMAINCLPEVTPAEPIPAVRGPLPGLWSLWEIRPNGSGLARDCFALFVSDSGRVRPDVAERLWVDIANGQTKLVDTPALEDRDWLDLFRRGADYAYRPCCNLQSEADWRAPRLTLRLLVRVTA